MTAALTAVAIQVASKVQEVQIPFEAAYRRSYGDFKELLEDLSGQTYIDIIGESYDDTALEDRGSGQWTVTVAIAIRRRFVPETEQSNEPAGGPRINVAELDALVTATQDINDYFMHPDHRRLTDDDYSLTWESTNIVFNPNRKMLLESHQFMGLIRVTYHASKTL